MGISMMPITVSGKPKSCMVNLTGQLTIENVKELCSELVPLIEGKESFVLNMGQVSSCDTAGLQLIWSFMKEADNRGTLVEIHDVSPAVFEMAYETGIEMEKILNFKRKA